MAKHKTVQLKTTIGQNDLERKIAQTKKFLEKGNSVKVTLYLYGRQKERPELGVNFLEKIYKTYLSEYKRSSMPTPQNLSLFFNAPPRKNEK